MVTAAVLVAVAGRAAAQSDDDGSATVGLDLLLRPPIAVSADGRRVLYVTPGESGDWLGTNRLVRFDTDSAASTRLLGNWPVGRFAYPALNGTGSMLAVQFQRGRGPVDGNPLAWHRELVIADLAADPTADLRMYNVNVLPPTEYSRGHMAPQFGANGDNVVFSFGARASTRGGAFSSQRIWMVGFDPRQDDPTQQVLTSVSLRKSRELLKADEFSPLVWPDPSRRLMFVLIHDIGGPDTAVRLYRRVDDDKPVPMTMPDEAPGVPVPVVHTMWPTTAPGSRLVVAQVGGWNLWSVVAFAADDSEKPRVLLEGTREVSFAHPSLAPGGKWLAYERQEIAMSDPPVNAAVVTSRSVRLRNLATREDVTLAEHACYPVISPDGRSVYCFVREPDESGEGFGPWEFRVLDLQGAITARDLGQLEASERERLAALVAQLGDESYTVRRDATNALKEFGQRALGELRRAEATAGDPEVKLRLVDVIGFLSSDPPRPPNDELKPRRD